MGKTNYRSTASRRAIKSNILKKFNRELRPISIYKNKHGPGEVCCFCKEPSVRRGYIAFYDIISEANLCLGHRFLHGREFRVAKSRLPQRGSLLWALAVPRLGTY